MNKEKHLRNEYERLAVLTLIPEFIIDINNETNYIKELSGYLYSTSRTIHYDKRCANGINEKLTQKLIDSRLKATKKFEMKYPIGLNPFTRLYKKYSITERALFDLFVVNYIETGSIPSLELLKKHYSKNTGNYETIFDKRTNTIVVRMPITITSSDIEALVVDIKTLQKNKKIKVKESEHFNLLRDIEAYKLSDSNTYSEIETLFRRHWKYDIYNSDDAVSKAVNRLRQLVHSVEKSINNNKLDNN